MDDTPDLSQLKSDPTLAFRPEEWSSTRPTERAARIKERLLADEREIDVERARYTTRSYRDTEGEPMPIRRAKMLLDLARNMSIAIYPDEVIVGNRSLLPRMGVIAPEGAVDWNVVMAGAVVAALPTALIYIFLGRYFVRGLLAGSLKG